MAAYPKNAGPEPISPRASGQVRVDFTRAKAYTSSRIFGVEVFLLGSVIKKRRKKMRKHKKKKLLKRARHKRKR